MGLRQRVLEAAAAHQVQWACRPPVSARNRGWCSRSKGPSLGPRPLPILRSSWKCSPQEAAVSLARSAIPLIRQRAKGPAEPEVRNCTSSVSDAVRSACSRCIFRQIRASPAAMPSPPWPFATRTCVRGGPASAAPSVTIWAPPARRIRSRPTRFSCTWTDQAPAQRQQHFAQLAQKSRATEGVRLRGQRLGHAQSPARVGSGAAPATPPGTHSAAPPQTPRPDPTPPGTPR